IIFYGWNHFKVKLVLQFRQWSLTSSTKSVACFDSSSVAPIAPPEVLHAAAIESDLANGKQEEATEIFDCQEFIIALEFECGVSIKELHSNDGKVRISEFIVSPKFACEVFEQVVGNHVMDVRRQNKAELSCLFCVQYSYEDSKKAFANQLF
ncbi:hypothetical protein H5410_012619, partial [Solanum commersonii]